jgi:hypothetical protein
MHPETLARHRLRDAEVADTPSRPAVPSHIGFRGDSWLAVPVVWDAKAADTPLEAALRCHIGLRTGAGTWRGWTAGVRRAARWSGRRGEVE